MLEEGKRKCDDGQASREETGSELQDVLLFVHV